MSSFIRSKYQQYKRDTYKLADWLAKAAVQNGYSIDGFAEADQSFDDGAPKPTANQVKNAKKKAKAKAKAQGRHGDAIGKEKENEQNVQADSVTPTNPPAPGHPAKDRT
ncbi:hypothetical protein IAU59_005318 [Kwoniella sp. CBS 9459]